MLICRLIVVLVVLVAFAIAYEVVWCNGTGKMVMVPKLAPPAPAAADSSDAASVEPLPTPSASIRQVLSIVKNLREAPFPAGLLDGGEEVQQQQQAPDADFFLDTGTLLRQITDNYAHSSPCPRAPVPRYCFGIGSTLASLAIEVADNLLPANSIKIFGDIDEKTCGWTERDHTRDCVALFGDCYLPKLRRKRRPSSEQRDAGGGGICHDISWFIERWGTDLYRIVVLSWMLGGQKQQQEPQGNNNNSSNTDTSLVRLVLGKTQQPDSSGCIALQVRRGDACINPDRSCFGYNLYMDAVTRLKRMYNQSQIVVMTDAHDFPLREYEAVFPGNVVTSSTNADRAVYNVNHMAGKDFADYAPENRDLGNTTSDFFVELASASRCNALVGTFTSGVSKLIFALIVAERGRIPPYMSLEGCPKNTGTKYIDECHGQGPEKLPPPRGKEKEGAERRASRK